MTQIILGVYNQISNKLPAYQKRVQGITEFGFDLLSSTGETRISKIIHSNSIDNILQQAGPESQKWLAITALGHRILSRDLVETMVNFAVSKSAAVVGHILDDCPAHSNSEFFSLHHQCVLIDLDQWRNIGCPAWGEYGVYQDQPLPMCVRSLENFHDDYTPLYLQPGQGTRIYSGVLKEGWNLIKSCLDAGLTVWNFDHETRRRKAHIYPEVGELEHYFNDASTQVHQPSQRQYIETMQSVPQAVFVFNNEPSNTNLVGNRVVNHLYCVAAGFKPLEFLQQRQFDSDTVVHYFDHSQPALDFRRWLVQNWDGCDYLWAIDAYRGVDPAFTANWLALQDYRPQWQIIVDKFGGADAWLALWQRYQQLSHQYHLLDVFDADHCSQLSNMVQAQTAQQHSVIWYSNAFYSDYSRFVVDTETLQAHYENFVDELIKAPGTIEIFGQDAYGKWEQIQHGIK